ncbi:hypothetical protein COU13_01445 [Candidatus Kaiserbacteria bacterium CG10_big_fil_rev_8_21_14_0_10_43_70]|uniref:ECF transporter S component n=1 Tax=Candidatus Kaiserbacteria bacterium CG10_big_fil_rev_8_21_14_0_10_43_70 TaxID=1974605 RepID=A0A2H0UIY1_9BACT|nr:MAG: hypothetical protein COU13_01445 [Candidatus Kaiserbacteria bacterium CG10_big_fil_rev_8_21_14_0_10_43_70]
MERAPKYIIGIIIVILLRLLPHPPNVEPITATLMPFAKKWGILSGAVFGVLTVLVFDVITRSIGPWSLFTAGAYALLGIFAGLYFSRVDGSRTHYVMFAVIGTLFYDAVTGLTVGPLFFDQPFMSALVGQIPFTLYHLAGNVVLAVVLSPLIERWLIQNPKLDTSHIFWALRLGSNTK